MDETMRSTCMIPIGGMVGYKDGPQVVDVGPVCFITASKLAEEWDTRGFQLDPVEYLREPYLCDLEASDIVAVVTESGSAAETDKAAVLQKIQKALWCLLACNSAWGPGARRHPVMPGIMRGSMHGFFYSEGQPPSERRYVSCNAIGPSHEIRLDGFWEANREAGFYEEMNRLVGGQVEVEEGWRVRLLEATELLGRARMSREPWEAFLFAMVGMERLLKPSARDGWKSSVKRPIEALFSWLKGGKGDWYAEQVEKLYTLRNQVVHEGRISVVTSRTAKIADEVLFNLLLASFKHLAEMRNLDDLIKRGQLVSEQVARGEKQTALPNAVAIHSFEYGD